MSDRSGVLRVEDDGTIVYRNYLRYRPVPEHERKLGRRKPDDPSAVRFHGMWFVPLVLLEPALREMPETRPDDDAYFHMSSNLLCRCDVCRRPAAERWRRKWRREQGLRS